MDGRHWPAGSSDVVISWRSCGGGGGCLAGPTDGGNANECDAAAEPFDVISAPCPWADFSRV